MRNAVKNYLLGLLGGFSSLGLYCFYKHFLARRKPSRIERLYPEDPRASKIVIHNGLVYISGQVGESG